MEINKDRKLYLVQHWQNFINFHKNSIEAILFIDYPPVIIHDNMTKIKQIFWTFFFTTGLREYLFPSKSCQPNMKVPEKKETEKSLVAQ